MNITISPEHNEARLQGTVNFLAQGTEPAWCELYSGVQPAFGAAPDVNHTLLASLELAEPIGTIDEGVLTLTPTLEQLIIATGVATWARVYNGNGLIAWDCDVSGIEGNGAIKIATQFPAVAQLYSGGMTRIVSGTLA